MLKKRGKLGGSSVWEEPQEYKNPEINPLDLVEKHKELRKKARDMK